MRTPTILPRGGPTHRPCLLPSPLRFALVLALALVAMPGAAAACAIDNTASLFAGGVQARLNTSSPTPGRPWATFTIDKAFASGASVSFNEARRELTRSLSAATIAAPYRWVFGDGATARGHNVVHRYEHAGLYRLVVYGYSATLRSWFPFDNALVHVVPPGQLLQANLGYYALRALDAIVSGLIWLIDAALVLFVAYVVLHRWRSRRASDQAPHQPPTRS